MSSSTGKDLKRAVAFLTLDKVQRTPESARVSFLKQKGFTDEEIAEAQRQAQEILTNRSTTEAAAGTFGGGSTSSGSTSPWPLTRVAAAGGGQKASSRVTVGGLTFVSLVSAEGEGEGSSSDGGEAAVAALLGKAVPDAEGKADVAAVMLVVGPGQGGAAHRALDAWVDPEHLPARQVVEQAAAGAPLQLFAVVRAR